MMKKIFFFGVCIAAIFLSLGSFFPAKANCVCSESHVFFGRVIDNGSGNSISGATVDLLLRSAGGEWPPVGSATTDANGHFSINYCTDAVGSRFKTRVEKAGYNVNEGEIQNCMNLEFRLTAIPPIPSVLPTAAPSPACVQPGMLCDMANNDCCAGDCSRGHCCFASSTYGCNPYDNDCCGRSTGVSCIVLPESGSTYCWDPDAPTPTPGGHCGFLNEPCCTSGATCLGAGLVCSGETCILDPSRPLPTVGTLPTLSLPTPNSDYYCQVGGGAGLYAGIKTAIGCVPVNNLTNFAGFFYRYILGFVGGIALLIMGFGAIKVITSAGNPEKVKQGQQLITATLTGLVFVIFSLFLLRLIGVDILQLPGISK